MSGQMGQEGDFQAPRGVGETLHAKRVLEREVRGQLQPVDAIRHAEINDDGQVIFGVVHDVLGVHVQVHDTHVGV